MPQDAVPKAKALEDSRAMTNVEVFALPLFKWLDLHHAQGKKLIQQLDSQVAIQDHIILVELPRAEKDYDHAANRFQQILAQVKSRPGFSEAATKEQIKHFAQNKEFLEQLQRILGSNVRSARARTLAEGEMTKMLELVDMSDKVQSLQKRLTANKDDNKLKEICALEYKTALVKLERLHSHLREDEEEFSNELQKIKDSVGDSSEGIWTVLESPILRRVACARLGMAEVATHHAALMKELKKYPEIERKIQKSLRDVAEDHFARMRPSTGGNKDAERQLMRMKFAHMVLTGEDHLHGDHPNLLLEYIKRGDHLEFMDWLKRMATSGGKVKKPAIKANADPNKDLGKADKPKVETKGKQVDPEKEQEPVEKKISSGDIGLPPKCKMPKVDYQRDANGTILPRTKATISMNVKWSPAHPQAKAFELYVKTKKRKSFKCEYIGPKDSIQMDLTYPGEYIFKVRGGNGNGFGEWSHEASVSLNKNGELKTGAADTPAIKEDAKTSEEVKITDFEAGDVPRNQKQNQQSLKLKKAVEIARGKLGDKLSNKELSSVYNDLKSAYLAEKAIMRSSLLLTKAKALLATLRQKELARDYRGELKSWTDILIEGEIENEDLTIEVFVQIKALDAERLNWFYQHQLSRSKKVAEAYTGSLDKMPLKDRDTHYRMIQLLDEILNVNELKAKMKEEFIRTRKSLMDGLERSKELEKQKEDEELARIKKSKELLEQDKIRREQLMKEEYIRIVNRDKERKAEKEAEVKGETSKEAESKKDETKTAVKIQKESKSKGGSKVDDSKGNKTSSSSNTTIDAPATETRDEHSLPVSGQPSTSDEDATAAATKKLFSLLEQTKDAASIASSVPSSLAPPAGMSLGRGASGRGRGRGSRGRGRGSRPGGWQTHMGPAPNLANLPQMPMSSQTMPTSIESPSAIDAGAPGLGDSNPMMGAAGSKLADIGMPGSFVGLNAEIDAKKDTTAATDLLSQLSFSPILGSSSMSASNENDTLKDLLSNPSKGMTPPALSHSDGNSPHTGGELGGGRPPPGLLQAGFEQSLPPGLMSLNSDLGLSELNNAEDSSNMFSGSLHSNSTVHGTIGDSKSSSAAGTIGESESSNIFPGPVHGSSSLHGTIGESIFDSGSSSMPPGIGLNANASPWGAESSSDAKVTLSDSLTNWNIGAPGDSVSKSDPFQAPPGLGVPPGLSALGIDKNFEFETHDKNIDIDTSSDIDPKVKKFLKDIKMSKYEHIFADNEIDWDAMLMLEKEDMMAMGIDKTGPLLKIKRALDAARDKEDTSAPVEVPDTLGMDSLGSLWSDVNSGTGGESGSLW